MIAGIFHEGSGLGDQLFRYITVRTLAEEKGYKWGMVGIKDFKGEFFLQLREEPGFMGTWVSDSDYKGFNEKDVRDSNRLDIRSYDPEINFVEDNTIIDGSFEDDKYWGHNLANINRWLAVDSLDVPEDKCIIGFRGGEYATQPDLFLTKEYWSKSTQRILELRGVGNITKFETHTDDPALAEQMLGIQAVPNERVSHSKHSNMGFNWRSARFAKYAIIPNSAFFILPRLLKHFEDPTAVTVAPRFWARRNTRTWARPACYYKPFTYI